MWGGGRARGGVGGWWRVAEQKGAWRTQVAAGLERDGGLHVGAQSGRAAAEHAAIRESTVAASAGREADGVHLHLVVDLVEERDWPRLLPVRHVVRHCRVANRRASRMHQARRTPPQPCIAAAVTAAVATPLSVAGGHAATAFATAGVAVVAICATIAIAACTPAALVRRRLTLPGAVGCAEGIRRILGVGGTLGVGSVFGAWTAPVLALALPPVALAAAQIALVSAVTNAAAAAAAAAAIVTAIARGRTLLPTAAIGTAATAALGNSLGRVLDAALAAAPTAPAAAGATAATSTVPTARGGGPRLRRGRGRREEGGGRRGGCGTLDELRVVAACTPFGRVEGQPAVGAPESESALAHHEATPGARVGEDAECAPPVDEVDRRRLLLEWIRRRRLALLWEAVEAAPGVAPGAGERRGESIPAALLGGVEPRGAALAHQPVLDDLAAHRAGAQVGASDAASP